MGVKRLDHVNLRTCQLGAMIDWYRTVLDLQTGWRPNFGFPGAWLYAEGSAIVHLVAVGDDAGAGSEQDLKLEHFALSATDQTGFRSRLEATGTRFETIELHDANIIQYNVWDPDGNHIHIDFALDD